MQFLLFERTFLNPFLLFIQSINKAMAKQAGLQGWLVKRSESASTESTPKTKAEPIKRY